MSPSWIASSFQSSGSPRSPVDGAAEARAEALEELGERGQVDRQRAHASPACRSRPRAENDSASSAPGIVSSTVELEPRRIRGGARSARPEVRLVSSGTATAAPPQPTAATASSGHEGGEQGDGDAARSCSKYASATRAPRRHPPNGVSAKTGCGRPRPERRGRPLDRRPLEPVRASRAARARARCDGTRPSAASSTYRTGSAWLTASTVSLGPCEQRLERRGEPRGGVGPALAASRAVARRARAPTPRRGSPRASRPRSEPKPISSSRGSTSAGRRRPASASASVSLRPPEAVSDAEVDRLRRREHGRARAPARRPPPRGPRPEGRR